MISGILWKITELKIIFSLESCITPVISMCRMLIFDIGVKKYA